MVNRTCSWQRHGSRTLCLALTLNLCKNNNTSTSRSPVTADTHRPRGKQRSYAIIVKMTVNLWECCVEYAISPSHKKIYKLQKFSIASLIPVAQVCPPWRTFVKLNISHSRHTMLDSWRTVMWLLNPCVFSLGVTGYHQASVSLLQKNVFSDIITLERFFFKKNVMWHFFLVDRMIFSGKLRFAEVSQSKFAT